MRIALVITMCVAAPAFSAEPEIRGRYHYGAEVESFSPCNSKNTYWVSGEASKLKSLRDRADRLRNASSPYPPIYVKFVGRVNYAAKREGFAADYDALFEVEKVVKASNVVPSHCAVRAERSSDREARKK